MSSSRGREKVGRRAHLARGAGEFFGYVTDALTGRAVYDEGAWEDVETALAWARERADEVVLRYGLGDDAIFSAGASPCRAAAAQPLPRWPPTASRRQQIDREAQAAEGTSVAPVAPEGRLEVVRPMIVRAEHEQPSI